MAIQTIGQISCSLNLGTIYSVDYSWSPQNGVQITLFFVNQNGRYLMPTLLPLQKVNIRIGQASFSVYPIKAKISYSANRRVMSVDFVDDTFQLEKYYITLPDRGCGLNVYPIGTAVDNRTVAQKQKSALDPDAAQIADFIEFPDYEYTFNDFLAVLRQKFTVTINASYDATVTNAYVGSFRSVLDEWMHFFNLNYFFENGTIKIYDPTRLFINLPTQPTTAIAYEIESDITSTYGKTVSNYFQQQGKELPLNQAGKGGNLYTRTANLYQIGHEQNLQQDVIVRGVNLGAIPNINQVIAAAYGQEFWFLYNYWNGSAATECGWTYTTAGFPATPEVGQVLASIQLKGLLIAVIDQNVFDQRFQAYSEYGTKIAGKYYLSDRKDTIDIDSQFQWFNESGGEIFDFVANASQRANIDFVVQPDQSEEVRGIINGTAINQYFPGVNFVGGRMGFTDQFDCDLSFFTVPTTLANEVAATFAALIKGADGSRSFDFSPLGNSNYIGYGQPVFSQDLQTLFASISDSAGQTLINNKPNPFLYRFETIPFVGISTTDYASLRAQATQPSDNTVITTSGPSISSDTGIIKAFKDGAYIIFYSKYAKCASASSADSYYGFRFDPRQISTDIQVDFSLTKNANNSYTLNRGTDVINALVNNPLLPALAQANPVAIKRVSFSLNTFYNVPVDFLTNGLVGMSISVGDNGITSSYTFSNEVLVPRSFEKDFSRFEQQIRNSWIRQNQPQEVAS